MKKILFLTLIIGFVSCQSPKIFEDENGVIKCSDDVGVGYIGEIDGVSYKVVDEKMLRLMIENNEDLRFICTSKITNMSGMFKSSYSNKITINGDLSNWDVSNVTDMSDMFLYSEIDVDLSNWDVGNVIDMSGMFHWCRFKGINISNWNVGSVTNMNNMFILCYFNVQEDLSNWDVSNVTDMSYMFYLSYFNNGDISNWNVSNVTDMTYMFTSSKGFNGDVSNWDVRKLKNPREMFYEGNEDGKRIYYGP